MAVGSVNLTLPQQSLDTIALESNASANVFGSMFNTRPMVALATSQGAVLTLPAQTMMSSGVVGNNAVVTAVKKPIFSVTSSGFVTNEGSVTCERPFQTLVSYGPNTTLLKKPMAALAAVGTTGNVGIAAVQRSIVSLVATGSNSNLGLNTSLARPIVGLQIVGTTGVVGNSSSAANTIRTKILAASGITGTVGTAELVVPLVQLTATGHGPMIGTVILRVPMVQLQATGTTSFATPAMPDGQEVPAIVMNTQTGALSHYVNFNYNSFAQFNGVALAANAEGLFVLTGDDDNGTKIQAAARLGIADFGTSFQKRIDRCYVGYRTDGNLVLRVRTDEVNQRDYFLQQSTAKVGLHGNHLRIGRGVFARYWQFEVRNNLGSNFSLNMIEVKPTKLRRRIGGSDA